MIVTCTGSGSRIDAAKVILSEVWYETPMGCFEQWEEAAGRCRQCDFDPELMITVREDHRTVRNVLGQLNAILEAEGNTPDEYGFDNSYGETSTYGPVQSVGADSPWPHRASWIAVYPVTGGSEGYYIHVDAINRGDALKPKEPIRQVLALAKCWDWDQAVRIAGRVATLLGA